MSSETSLVRYVLGANKTKYAVLDELFNRSDFRDYDCVYFLVDGHAIFQKLFQNREIAPQYADSFEDLVQDIVIGFYNVLGHYRRYFATHLERDNVIIASFNDTAPKYEIGLIPEFEEKQYWRYSKENIDYYLVNKALKAAWSYICSLSRYFEDIYCIYQPGVNDFTTLSYATQQCLAKRPGHPMLVYSTKNQYASQFILGANTMVLYPSRDDTKLYTWNNIVNEWILKKNKTKVSNLFYPNMLLPIWCYCGLKDVGVEALPFFAGRTAKFISGIDTIRTQMVWGRAPQCLTMAELRSFIPSFYPKTKRSTAEMQVFCVQRTIFTRYKALSNYLSLQALAINQKENIRSQLINLYNQNELEDYNNILANGEIDPNLLELDNLNMSRAARYY